MYTSRIQKSTAAWRLALKKYQNPDVQRSVWQLVNTVITYIALWVGMVWSLGVSYWLTLALAVPAVGMVVRMFIVFHDCGHGARVKRSLYIEQIQKCVMFAQ